MNVLIAGCGYVGCALAERLRDDGHRVAGLRRTPSAIPEGVEAIAADLADVTSLEDALRGREFDQVVYAAAADGRDESAYQRAYVDGLRNVLAVLPTAQRLLFTSSTAVYGQTAAELVDERSATEPSRFTGTIMLEAERIARDYAAPSSAVRFGGIYGPGRTRMIDRVRSGQAELSAEVMWTNRIHRDDCAAVLAHLMFVDPLESIYVAVDDDPCDKNDVLRWLAAQVGREELSTASRGAGNMRGAGKRCSNARLAQSGYRFIYPSFRDGYGEMI